MSHLEVALKEKFVRIDSWRRWKTMAPPVPEILLKKRKQVEEARVHKAALAGEGKHKKRRTQDFKRAEVFVEEFRAKVSMDGVE